MRRAVRIAVLAASIGGAADAWASDTPAVASRRQCDDAIAGDRLDEAIQRCEQSLELERSTDTLVSLARARLRRNRGDDVRLAETLAAEAVAQSPLAASAFLVQCEVAITTKSSLVLQGCAARLQSVAPDDGRTWAFAALSAYGDGDLGRGDEAKARAEALGVPPPLLAEVRTAEAQCRAERPPPSAWTIVAAVLGALAVATVLLSAIGDRLSRETLRALSSGQPPPNAVWRRGVYRAVVWAGAALFWVLLPVVSSAMLALAAFATYQGLRPQPFPIVARLSLVVGAGALVSFFATVRAMSARVDDVRPGIPLDLADHPRLRTLLLEVSERVGTRVPDEVQLVVHGTFAVAERGGRLDHLLGRARRSLVLGAGALEALTQRDLRVLLAHELGHYKSADTAGGHLSLGVQAAYADLVAGLTWSRVAAWYNPAWWFVVGYGRFFARLSRGASRLQEILADRAAVNAYGSAAFVEAALHLLSGTTTFDLRLEAEAEAATAEGRPLSDLFGEARLVPDSAEIDRIVEETLAAETGEFDSHPAWKDRLAVARALAVPSVDDGGQPAWDLLDRPEHLATALMEEARQRLLDLGIALPRARR